MKIFLHKYLPKSLLLMALFLGSCGLFESSDSDFKELIGGKTGIFRLDDVTYGFTISSDAKTYIESDGINTYTLSYSYGSSDKVTYDGTMKILGKDYDVEVILSSLTEYGGVYTMYMNDTLWIDDVGFAWASYSTSSYSSIFETISQ